jgi:hypothetical protein
MLGGAVHPVTHHQVLRREGFPTAHAFGPYLQVLSAVKAVSAAAFVG